MSSGPIKAVIDCSQAGQLAPDAAAALAEALNAAAFDAVKNGDLEKAAALIQDANDALAAGVATTIQMVELSAEEIADLEAHRAEQAELHRETLLAHIEHRLAQTDRHVIDALERVATVPKAIAAHRQKLRDLAAHVETADVDDLAKVKIPDPPAEAAVT